jgi:hypothetical protein
MPTRFLLHLAYDIIAQDPEPLTLSFSISPELAFLACLAFLWTRRPKR